MAAKATFALNAGVWFRRGRLLMVSPDSLGTACPLSGKNSTYRPVHILEASSMFDSEQVGDASSEDCGRAAIVSFAGDAASAGIARCVPLDPGLHQRTLIHTLFS
jgi:hypothetical protein